MIPDSHRNLWPIAITGSFALFFIGLVAFIAFASTHKVDLVRNDYYEEELRYQRQFDRVRRTQEFAEGIFIGYDATRQCITLRLPQEHVRQSAGQIHLYRPSDAKLDQRIPLALDSTATQMLDTRKLRPGLWKVRVQWTSGGQEFFSDQTLVLPVVKTS